MFFSFSIQSGQYLDSRRNTNCDHIPDSVGCIALDSALNVSRKIFNVLMELISEIIKE